MNLEQMVGLDAKFLYSETPTAHMHTLKVAVFDGSRLPERLSYDEVVELFGSRLYRLPSFRRRAVPVPLGLGHPVWVEDPCFDLRRHVTLRQVAAPGGQRELASVVADIAGRPLPRDRALWEIVVVDGLAGRRVAVVAKVHHALADGAATVALLQNVLDSSILATPTEDVWRPEALPTQRQLLALAARGHVTRLRGLWELVTLSVQGLRQAEAWRRSSPVRPPLPFDGPKTTFNVSLSPDRTFAMTSLALDDLKAVRRALGATLNDVFLSVCAGAVRAYLADRGELPTRPLVASVPVSTDPSLTRLGGNRVDNLFVSIGTDIADPIARVRHIHTVSTAAKQVRSAFGNDLLRKRAEVVPPQLYAFAVRTWSRTRLANRLRPPVNLILSNVAGPPQQLHVGNATLEAVYSVGPILEGVGLNVTAWSYNGSLCISLLGCPSSVPDPWMIADRLSASLAELMEAVASSAEVLPAGDDRFGAGTTPAGIIGGTPSRPATIGAAE
jgi:diacylglycerol O-acyltransferase